MNILYVAMRYDYGNPARGDSFEHWAFQDTLRAMGHTLVCFDQVASKKSMGKRSANSHLWQLAASGGLDMMFSVLFTSELRQKMVRNISGDRGIPTVNWFTDDAWRFDSYTKNWAPCFSWCVTTHAPSVNKYKAAGYKNIIQSQWAHNPRTHKKVDTPKVHDVSFIGQPHGARKSVLRGLAKDGVEVWRRGHGCPQGRLPQNQYAVGISSSKVNLNFCATSKWNQSHVTARVFEVTACGGFLLTDAAPDLDAYFVPGKEVVVFDGYDDLLDKIRYYVDHDTEREQIAEAGYKRCKAEHTYEKRLAEVFKKMGLQ